MLVCDGSGGLSQSEGQEEYCENPRPNRTRPLYDKPVSRPVALFFEWLVIPVRCRSPLAPRTLSEPPELHFKRILAKTVICSAAQLICAAADVNPPGVLAHSVQFGT